MKPAIGTKVIPHSKTVTNMKGLDKCEYWADAINQGQGFLYIVDYDRNDYVLSNEPPKGYDHEEDYEWNVIHGYHHSYRGTGNLYKETDITVIKEITGLNIFQALQHIKEGGKMISALNKEYGYEDLDIRWIGPTACNFRTLGMSEKYEQKKERKWRVFNI
ncbi:hypothetical protein SAMN04487895_10339 [Paenibacillus sophorae]|uniref:Uncharacterized protein n=1 Tax=Paenibacillus sophorae TaxID=1333845 RepID=A0A1H8JIR8_9BACL|nr:hypothetical protein [Paenibacillus sophorae]QWU13376.1 hypothetical protein KP014_15350 [Paenibacillus sophorae]SEN80582.1 hypothetical protein SAMN04487895_10339 [Paenibacillus sophorae]